MPVFTGATVRAGTVARAHFSPGVCICRDLAFLSACLYLIAAAATAAALRD